MDADVVISCRFDIFFCVFTIWIFLRLQRFVEFFVSSDFIENQSLKEWRWLSEQKINELLTCIRISMGQGDSPSVSGDFDQDKK